MRKLPRKYLTAYLEEDTYQKVVKLAEEKEKGRARREQIHQELHKFHED